MPYCSRCGVEVGEEVETCPLCNTPLQKLSEDVPTVPRLPEAEPSRKPRMSAAARRNLAWEVVSILSVIAVVVVAGSDLRAHSSLSWSLFPIAGVALAWIVTTLALYLSARPWMLAAGIIVASAAFLAAVDLATGGLSWFVGLGLPLLALLVVVGALVTLVLRRIRFVGLNVVALISLAVALVCTGIDAAIEYYLSGRPGLGWSIIVLQALLPFAGIMLFLHLRLRSRFDFKRIFHL